MFILLSSWYNLYELEGYVKSRFIVQLRFSPFIIIKLLKVSP